MGMHCLKNHQQWSTLCIYWNHSDLTCEVSSDNKASFWLHFFLCLSPWKTTPCRPGWCWTESLSTCIPGWHVVPPGSAQPALWWAKRLNVDRNCRCVLFIIPETRWRDRTGLFCSGPHFKNSFSILPDISSSYQLKICSHPSMIRNKYVKPS